LHQCIETTGLAQNTRRWHLVFTKPSAEEVAKAHLERQGYGVYLPRLKEKVLRRNKWRDRVAALFPRYLFVHLDAASQSLSPIRSTVGVANIVRFGVDYTAVPHQVVNNLIEHEDPETGLHQLRVSSWFKPGATVRVASGVFSGIEGVFQCEDADERVIILLNLLGRETCIKIDAGDVVPNAA
jgi:transcriptional antiterminator RfaH